MKKYSTSVINLIDYFPLVQFTKEDVYLLNFLESTNHLMDNNNIYLQEQFDDLLQNNSNHFITDISKTSDFIKLANKKYSPETLHQLLKTFSLLFNKNEIFFEQNFSLSSDSQFVLLAKYFSNPNENVIFWSDIDPEFANTPIQAIYENDENFSESKFKHIQHSSPWSKYTEGLTPHIDPDYINLHDEKNDIFKMSQLNPNDPLDVIFLIEQISLIDHQLNGSHNFKSAKDWANILNIPSNFKKQFYDDFSTYLKNKNQNQNTLLFNNLSFLQNFLFLKTLKNIKYETLTHPQVISCILDHILTTNFINKFSTVKDCDLLQIFHNHNLFNSSNFLKLSYQSDFSPLYLLDKSQNRSTLNPEFNYDDPMYENILNKFPQLEKSQQTIDNLSLNMKDQDKNFLMYLSKYISLLETDILKNDNVLEYLKNLSIKNKELFLFGFPLFSDDFKNNADVLEYLSKKIYNISKNNPFAVSYGNGKNPLLNAILFSYNFDDLYKHKSKLLNLSIGYFSSSPDNSNSNYHCPTLNLLVVKLIGMELTKLVITKSLANLDIEFLINMFDNSSKMEDDRKIESLIEHSPYLPQLETLGDINFLKEIVPYFLSCIHKMKKDEDNYKDFNKIRNVICKLTQNLNYYAYSKNPKEFEKNIYNLNLNNFHSYKAILATTSHFSMINPEIINTLDSNNTDHQLFFIDLIKKNNIKTVVTILSYPQIKPFLMLKNVINELVENSKFASFNLYGIPLTHIYNSEDVKYLFNSYGHDNQNWFMFCPSLFLTLAPIEYKQNFNTWKTLFTKELTKIMSFVPMNLKNNPDFFIELSSTKNVNIISLYKHFSRECLNSIGVVKHLLEKFPQESRNIYPELITYLKKQNETVSNLPLIEQFNLIFNDKILEDVIPINNPTKNHNKINKF